MGLPAEDVSAAASSPGLPQAEAETRLRAEGYNELPQSQRRTPMRIVMEVLPEPMLALLLCGGVIYLFLGDLRSRGVLPLLVTNATHHAYLPCSIQSAQDEYLVMGLAEFDVNQIEEQRRVLP